MTPRVSVVIPTYNRAKLIAEAIESALSQEVDGGLEVVVVDDGSTDDTAGVVASFGDRVRYVQQENAREGAARNRGARLAAGTYLAFLDSDDAYLPGKLRRDLERLEAPDQPALVYSRAENVDPTGASLGVRRLASPQGDVFWHLARENFVPMSSVVVRADAFRALGGFVEDPRLSGTADWECWVRLSARWLAGFVDQAATRIRVHPSNMLGDPSLMERAMLSGVRHALADEVVARRIGRRAGWMRAHMFVTIAMNAWGNGHEQRARLWLSHAARDWPAIVLDPRYVSALARVALGRSRAATLKRRIGAVRA